MTPGAQALRAALRQSIERQKQVDDRLPKPPTCSHPSEAQNQKCRWPVCQLLCQPVR